MSESDGDNDEINSSETEGEISILQEGDEYSLSDVPDEIFSHIFQFLPPRTLCIQRRINTRTNNLIGSDIFWEDIFRNINGTSFKYHIDDNEVIKGTQKVKSNFFPQLLVEIQNYEIRIREEEEKQERFKRLMRNEQRRRNNNIRRVDKMKKNGSIRTLISPFYWVTMCGSCLCPPIGVIFQFLYFLKCIYNNGKGIRNYDEGDCTCIEFLSCYDYINSFFVITSCYVCGCCPCSMFLTCLSGLRLICCSHDPWALEPLYTVDLFGGFNSGTARILFYMFMGPTGYMFMCPCSILTALALPYVFNYFDEDLNIFGTDGYALA